MLSHIDMRAGYLKRVSTLSPQVLSLLDHTCGEIVQRCTPCTSRLAVYSISNTMPIERNLNEWVMEAVGVSSQPLLGELSVYAT